MATERNVVDFKIHNLTEEQFQELKAQGKIDPNAVYCTPDESLKTDQITNCITEIPQDIKLELADGVLTLKAGSTYYTPNGVNTYTKTTTTADKTLTNTNNTQWAVFVNQAGNLQVWQLSTLYSGATAPSGVSYPMWWDTTNNIIKISNDSGATWVQQFSLPLCIITVSNGAISSIDQVFNGFGYIGSTIFALPGVKGLIPNGRNEDGTLKNIVVNNTSLKTVTKTTAYSAIISIYSNGGIDGFGALNYNSDTNLNYNSNGNQLVLNAGTVIFGSGGLITSFEPKPAFHAVDYNDFETLSDTVKTNNDNAVHKTGNETIAGGKKFTSAIQIGAISANDSHEEVRFADDSGQRVGVLRATNAANGNRRIEIFTATADGSRGSGIGVYTTADGKEYHTANTPDATSNTNHIATTAWVNTRLGGTGITSTEIGYLDGVTSAIQTQLNGKANTAASNFTAAGKGTIVNLTVPNYSAGVTFTLNKSTSYTAPKDGFVFIHTGRANDQGSNIKINGTAVATTISNWSNIPYFFPVAKGTVVSTDYDSISTAIFYPLKGAN